MGLCFSCWGARLTLPGRSGGISGPKELCEVGSTALLQKCWQPGAAAVLQRVRFNLQGGTDSTVWYLLKARRMQLIHQSVKMAMLWVGEA